MKKQYIITENKEIKTFIEKNKRIPKTCKIGNTIYSIYSTSYLSALMIQNNFQDTDYKLVDVILYDGVLPKDVINEKVFKEDYLKMISNFVNYCRKTKRVPAYVTTTKSKTKVSFDLFVYCLAKIIVYYQENNTLPNYCLFSKGFNPNNETSKQDNKNNNSQSTSNNTNTTLYVSKPHPTKPGCGGMGQDTNYYCGVSALQKVLFKFGITDYSQKTLAGWAGTTTAGTSHQGIRTAVAMVNKKKGTKITVTEKTFSEIGGWKGIGQVLANPKKDIIFHNLYRLQYGHYEVMNKLNTKTSYTQILNSLGNKCTNTCYCGYLEERSCNFMKQYMDGISQKSLIILTKE